MNADPIESVRAQLVRDGAMRALVTAILDRCDRRGVLPKRMALRCRSHEEHEAAVRLLSASGVCRRGDSLHLDLARADERLRAEGWPGLSEVLYAAAGREPKNFPAETGVLAGSVSLDLHN